MTIITRNISKIACHSLALLWTYRSYFEHITQLLFKLILYATFESGIFECGNINLPRKNFTSGYPVAQYLYIIQSTSSYTSGFKMNVPNNIALILTSEMSVKFFSGHITCYS